MERFFFDKSSSGLLWGGGGRKVGRRETRMTVLLLTIAAFCPLAFNLLPAPVPVILTQTGS